MSQAGNQIPSKHFLLARHHSLKIICYSLSRQRIEHAVLLGRPLLEELSKVLAE